MAYIDKINKNSTDYDIQDSKAARSVDGTTASHVEEANEIYTTTTQSTTSEFIYRTTAGDVSINTGDASINYIVGNTVQTGHTDETLNAVGVFAESGTTVSLDKSTWRSYVSTDGTYEFSYDGTNWKLSGNTVTISNYGLSVSGTLTSGDTITVEYTQLVIGTLATATPATFVSTGFNQYDATAGYAHVVGGNQYRIAGTYTSLGFTTTVGGTTTAVTVTDNKFIPSEDGYIYVTGGSGDILIALVWSGTMDSEPYSAYSTTSVTIPTVDASNTSLPTATYGMPSVRGVADRLSFADKTYVQNIGHYSYSAENLATVEALGVDYWYDTNDIFYVLASPITYNLADSVSGAYTANDYGTEEFTGTAVALTANITYGNSLVDKLRNLLDIQSIGTGLTLTGTQLSVSGGGGPTVVQTTGTSQTDVMSQNAVTSMVYADPGTGRRVRIGNTATIGSSSIGIGDISTSWQGGGNSVIIGRNSGSYGDSAIAIGDTALISSAGSGAINLGRGQCNSIGAISIGSDTTVGSSRDYALALGYGITVGAGATSSVSVGRAAATSAQGAIALGAYSSASSVGEMNIGSSQTSYGYNSSNYRLLTGLYDPQNAHDAATKGYVDPTTDSSAPTTATVGRLGQIQIDTTTATAYMCVAVDTVTPAYTWKQITA